MPTPSHQTIRLSGGRHTRPEHGACVMELASMLAGEPFTDHPASVSPVLGAFLRAYNDRIDDDRRQSLYRYAAMVVGTRAADDVEAARAATCKSWAEAMAARGGRFSWSRWRAGLRGRRPDSQTPTGIARATGELAAALARQVGEASALELVDRLIALPGAQGMPEPVVVGDGVCVTGVTRRAAVRFRHVDGGQTARRDGHRR